MVFVLDSKTLQLRFNYTTENGIASIDFTKAWIYSDYLYINGSQGVSKIKLGEAYYNGGMPSLKLTDVFAEGKLITTNQLSHQQNNLKINLDIRSFTTSGKLYWRLNEKDWRILEGPLRLY